MSLRVSLPCFLSLFTSSVNLILVTHSHFQLLSAFPQHDPFVFDTGNIYYVSRLELDHKLGDFRGSSRTFRWPLSHGIISRIQFRLPSYSLFSILPEAKAMSQLIAL